jgi:predicted ATPase/DNA-binding winged helix-turn-helix (wHTH) protein/Tfp pilus assembly protein PilF
LVRREKHSEAARECAARGRSAWHPTAAANEAPRDEPDARRSKLARARQAREPQQPIGIEPVATPCRQGNAAMDSSSGRSISFGPFRLYPDARAIEREGVRLALGSRALDLLIVLVERAGEVVSHKELTQRVWRELVVTPSSLRVHIANLRKALSHGEDDAGYIANLPGQGYSFTAPVSHAALPTSVEAPAAPRHNLPHALTSFVGREKELTQLEQLMDSTRLLTLTGAGGCGKTRLALELAGRLQERYADGVRLVELAPLQDATPIAATIAKVLEVEDGGGALEEALAQRLADRQLLLVLDNAEHLVEACAPLAHRLLQRCAGLRVLVTSREPLGVSGELSFRVPSLTLPDEADDDGASVLASEAARLFVDRARLHRPDFELAPRHARTLAAVCRRLDGIALAIELAASRMRTMSIEELEGHLDNRFGILNAGHRTAMSRHRTLRSLIDWSYDLLSSAEKILLRRLAVFAGGCEVDAVAAICERDAAGQPCGQLVSLCDKSLVLAEMPADTTRFRMLETMRHYARERLRDSGEEARVRQRHADFHSQLVDELDAVDQTDEAREGKLKRLDRELDNLRAALAWCDADPARAPQGLRIAGRLVWFWMTRGLFSEGRMWLARFLAATAQDEGDEHRAKALSTAGLLAYHQDDYDSVVTHLEAAIAICRRLGLRERAGTLLGNLGGLAVNRGQYAKARDLLEEALALARETNDSRHTALWLSNLGVMFCAMDDFDSARVVLEECVPISREVGKWSAAGALQQLGWVRHAQGQVAQARALLHESLELHREFEDKLGIARTLYYLAMVSHDEGDTAGAKAQLREALALQQAVGDRILTASTLEVLAGLSLEFAAPTDAATDAARLWGAAERLREEIGAPQERVLQRRTEGQVAAARAMSRDAAAFDAAWSEGRGASLEATVRHALAL